MLVTKEFLFNAAHKLQTSVGEPLHGHNYKLAVTCSGKPKNGMVIEYHKMEEVVKDKIIGKLDNSFLNDFFKQPTAENILIWVWDELKNDLPVTEVRLWENPHTSVAIQK